MSASNNSRSVSGGGGGGGVDMATFELLTSQMGEMKLSVEGLEKERDFYFNKVSPSPFLPFTKNWTLTES